MPKSNKDLSYSEQHVQERALERYGLEFHPTDYRKLNDAIHRAREVPREETSEQVQEGIIDNDTELVESGAGVTVALQNDEGGDEQIWSVKWVDQTLVCVWSKQLGRVTTLLPEGTEVKRRKGTKARKGKK